MVEQKKSTLTVDENDILTLSQKIQKNKNEDRTFAEKLEKYLSNVEKTTEPLLVGSTPNALAISGANPNLNVVIAPRTIAKCMAEADEQYHGHGLGEDIMKQLPEQLRNPAMIFKGNKDNSLVAITELKDKENREIMIAVSLSEKDGFREVNRISSAYGRNNMPNFLKNQMEQGNLIAVNKEKAERMLHSAGLQLPLENTFFSFDNSIAYSEENVKTVQAENYRKNAEKLLPFLNAKYRSHLSQIDNFNEKKAECIDKINYRQGKLEKLTAKAERLTHTNKMLKSMFENTRFSNIVNIYIKRNEDKIRQIQEERIPKHSQKIDVQNEKIKKLNHKLEVKQCKADKLYHLSNLIKSFGILNGQKRHKQFTTALGGLYNASQRSVQFKLDKCNASINKLNEQSVATNSEVSKINIGQQLIELHNRNDKLSNKLNKLKRVSLSISEQSPEIVNKLIDRTEKQINTAIQSENLTIAELADNISVSNAEYLHDITQNEQKKIQDNERNEIQKTPEKEKSSDEQRITYQKINPEYFNSIKDNRYTKKANDDVADLVMKQLDENGIKYSAVRLANNVTGMTVHKDNQEIFDKVLHLSIQQQKKNAIKAKKQETSYNSEFYMALPKENRFISEFATKTAQEYINALSSADCKYSYKVKKTDRIAVTIDNKDKTAMQVYNQFTNSIDVSQARGNVADELSERGFTAPQVKFIQSLLENPEITGSALYTFVDKIKPEYSNHQIFTICDKITEIYAQPELDRIQDKNNLYGQLTEQLKTFDCEIDLQNVTENHDYTESQKNELLNAIKSGISPEALSTLDESYSADEIHKYVGVYQTYDVDKINNFHQEHKDRLANSEKKTLTMSRSRIKDTAQKIATDNPRPIQKAVDYSL